MENDIEPVNKFVDNLSNDDIANMLATFGKSYNSIHMYFLKHLNRYRKVRMDIPIWRDNKFVANKIIIINETPKGSFISKDYQIKIGVKPEEIKSTYTIIYNIIDIDTNTRIASGICDTRKDVWEKYLSEMKNAYNLYRMLYFC
jgi:hypothetical protein